MAIEEDDDDRGGIPEWVVTFGDMMSLLLTFFIMLVSLSEIKAEEKYQALVESIREQFGHESSRKADVPGKLRPRNANLKHLATMGRARKVDLVRGGDKVQAPAGDHPRVLIVRPGTKTSIGTVVFFEEGGTQLSEQNRSVLRQLVCTIEGKPQKIEIRGHTSRRPVDQEQMRDHWDLAYERCRQTMDYLSTLNIDRKRMRMAVAGPHEPIHIGTDQEKARQNPRVEVYLLDQVVSDLEGTPEELKNRFDAGSP